MSQSRHAQRKAATHQGLIDAARDVIAEKGYNHVDILDITERANVSKATFYKHFANKEACVRELMSLWRLCEADIVHNPETAGQPCRSYRDPDRLSGPEIVNLYARHIDG